MREQMLLQYSYLTDGESEAGQMCPVCRGGSSGESTLSVSRRGDNLLWKCHRDSCGWAGGSGSKEASHGRRNVQPTILRGMVGRTYYRQASSLPEECVQLLRTKYCLAPWQYADLGWAEEEKRVVLPVKDWDGELIGSVLRSENGAQPKAKLHAEDNAVSCFRNYESDKLIVVEDFYSALRASQYMNAAAILGTHLNDERISVLKEIRCNTVYLALDADAFASTIKFVKKFRSDLRMIPVKLEKDLKNMSPQELEEFFNELH